MKRGISPLISWVLIVALSVAIGAVVVPVILDKANEWDFDPPLEYCNDISISLKGVCKESDGVLHVNLSNNGDFSIQKITVGKTTNVTSEQWCTYSGLSSYFPLTPGSMVEIPFSLNENYTSDITNETSVGCSALSQTDSIVGAAKLEIVPWINPEKDVGAFQCPDQRIVWDDSIILNTNCT
jgi:hypothetical protein